MADKTYNGWTNRETWVVNLWMDSDYWSSAAQDALNHCAGDRRKATQIVADALEESTMEESPLNDATLYQDLLGYAFCNVNWREIADACLADKVYEGEEEEQESEWFPPAGN